MFLPKANCSSHQPCFYPPATLNSPSTTAGPEQLSIRLLAVAGGTGEKRKATEVLFLARLDRCRSKRGVDMADRVFPKDFPDFIAEAPGDDGDRPARVRGLLSLTSFSTNRLLGSSYCHGRRVEAAGCRLPSLSRCRTASRLL